MVRINLTAGGFLFIPPAHVKDDFGDFVMQGSLTY